MSTRFTVKTPADFIALAPVVLGFQPERSLVMMSVDSFHARVDLPGEHGIDEVIDVLLEPAMKHSVNRVAFVIYDDGDHDELKRRLVDAFHGAAIDILAALQFRGDAYSEFGSDQWEPFDIATHRITLDALYEDRAPRHASRDAMAESIRPTGAEWDDDARMAVADLTLMGVEHVISTFDLETAREKVELWSGVLRGCEPDDELVGKVALVLGFACWLSGDGAKGWAALDLADKSSPIYAVLDAVLSKAVPPSMWAG